MYQLSDFISADLKIEDWNDIKPYFDKLQNHPLDSVEDLDDLILHYSETLSVFHEQSARAYINMTCHTHNQDYIKRHEKFSTEISPEVDKVSNKIQQMIVHSQFFDQLPKEKYAQLHKAFKRDLEIFREENVPLDAELSKLSSKYGQLAGSLMVKLDGEEIPIPQASVKLESDDREERYKTWLALQETRQSAKDPHDQILDQMIKIRHQKAINAGYKNFRDYQHDNLHRFDYTVDDVLKFHQTIKEDVIPVLKTVTKRHQEHLGLTDDYRPWDVAGIPKDEPPLKPFQSGKELLDKAIKIFAKIRPEFGKNLKTMDQAGLFDLESRKGKAPGGYNYGLEVTGMPFIFMNAAGVHRDVITLMHEGGHAMHTFLTNDQPLIQYRNCPSEVAETASMSMELISSNYWDEYYDPESFKRAKREHLEGIVSVFPWVAIVDGFQHWLYTNPNHTHQERDDQFDKLMVEFGTGQVNWEGYIHFRKILWQKQLHIFEVPFYYIEYAIAQLGALQIYKNYVQDPQKAVDDYIKGLSLGSTRPIHEVWQAMNIKFDFSKQTLKELMDFVADELEKLN